MEEFRRESGLYKSLINWKGVEPTWLGGDLVLDVGDLGHDQFSEMKWSCRLCYKYIVTEHHVMYNETFVDIL